MNAATLIHDLVTRSGLSKAELARRSGISRSSLDEYLHSKRQPSVAQLERLGESAGLRLEIAWAPIQVHADPSWLIPNNPAMADAPTTKAQRAYLLDQVVAVATELQRRERSPHLAFPPFRTLRAS